MCVPRVRERVQVAGRSGVFLVVLVDHERQEANLIPLHSWSSVEESVPFSKLKTYRETLRSNRH
jgi:hypothetical protein